MHSDYRIKKKTNNYVIKEPIEDEYQMSIHSSSNISPNKRRKHSQGVKYRQVKLDRSTYRYRSNNKNLATSSVTTTINKTRAKPSDQIR